MNGFVKQQLDIGSKQPLHGYKLCGKCEIAKPPEGGIHMSPSKWVCAMCWTNRTTSRNLKNAKT